MSDGACVIVKAGSAGGSVKLLGQSMPGGEWRFAVTTVDHTAELLGERDLERVEGRALAWVDSWEEGLRLLDRYPWVRLHPVYLHPDFVQRVKTALEDRLVNVDASTAEDVRWRWGRVFLGDGR